MEKTEGQFESVNGSSDGNSDTSDCKNDGMLETGDGSIDDSPVAIPWKGEPTPLKKGPEMASENQVLFLWMAHLMETRTPRKETMKAHLSP